MTAKQKKGYEVRTASRLVRLGYPGDVADLLGKRIVHAVHAFHYRAVPGNQQTKKWEAEMDRSFHKAFPAVIRALG